ncbi:MAG: hypothetical protein SXA11_09800 [Cyanobacteriota bacterium]|nr:hypothetical protein [Cyanobacteriota bacterium]
MSVARVRDRRLREEKAREIGESMRRSRTQIPRQSRLLRANGSDIRGICY